VPGLSRCGESRAMAVGLALLIDFRPSTVFGDGALDGPPIGSLPWLCRTRSVAEAPASAPLRERSRESRVWKCCSRRMGSRNGMRCSVCQDAYSSQNAADAKSPFLQGSLAMQPTKCAAPPPPVPALEAAPLQPCWPCEDLPLLHRLHRLLPRRFIHITCSKFSTKWEAGGGVLVGPKQPSTGAILISGQTSVWTKNAPCRTSLASLVWRAASISAGPLTSILQASYSVTSKYSVHLILQRPIVVPSYTLHSYHELIICLTVCVGGGGVDKERSYFRSP
jgi:hypothetical protein